MTYRILVVDDEIDFLDIMSEFLQDEGYVVTTATNGESALAILEKETFNLLVSDINMPGMKGFELLHRAAQLFPRMKRILITAYEVRDYLSMAKNYDIGNIMTKTTPFNFDEIKTLTKNILTENIFGLGTYINGTISTFNITSNDDIEKANTAVIDFMKSERNKRKFKQAMGEIVINAFFYGAKEEKPDKKHFWRFDTFLRKEEEIVVSWARDSEKTGVAVTDQKGRLTKKDVIYWLERNTIKDNNGYIVGLSDSHGKGLFITREIIDRLIINIAPRKKTEIIMINYEEGLYEGYRPLWIQEL